MANKYLVTILLITYNHSKWIRKSIESVLEQETNFPFIIKLFDDKSTDDSLAIAKTYITNKYNKIIQIYTNENNIGVAKNFKKAFTSVDTKYFCFLETDDYWCDKTKLQQQFDILENNLDCVMCGTNTRIYNIGTMKESFICRGGILSNGFNSNNKNCIFSFEEAPYIHTSSHMYRGDLVDFSKEPNRTAVDIYHYYKCLSLGKIYYINKIMSVYNQTGLGDYTSHSQIKQKLMNCNAYLMLNKYFKYRYELFYQKTSLNSIMNSNTKINKIITKLIQKYWYW